MISLTAFILWVLALAIIGWLYWYLSVPKNLPLGPVGLPFFGSALEYFDPPQQLVNLKENVKKYGPIFKLYIGSKLVVFLNDYETVQEAMVKQGDVFAGRPMLEDEQKGVIFVEGDLWKEQRRFALSTLRDLGVGRPILEPRILEEIEHLNEEINEYASNGQSFDPQRLLSCSVANIVSHLVFGRRFDYDDERFVDIMMKVIERSSGIGASFLSPMMPYFDFWPAKLIGFIFWREFKKIESDLKEFTQYVKEQIAETALTFDPNSDADNYIHAFLKAKEQSMKDNSGNESNFNDEQLLTVAEDLFGAGVETTVNTLRWGLLFLALHPETQEKLFEEIKNQVGTNSLPGYADRTRLPYAEALVMETQRLANLVPLGFMRRTLVETKLMGYDIPKGTVVFPVLSHILHNPEYFPNPKKFDPERFIDANGRLIRDPKLIPFQSGKRVCLGEPLARMELFLLVTDLVSRFRFRIPEDRPKPTMEPVIGFSCAPSAYELCVEARE